MTEQYLRDAFPDGISGAVSACSGIRNSIVLLNGPTGCKTYYCFYGTDGMIRPEHLWNLKEGLRPSDAMDEHLIRSQYYTGSAWVPSTNLRYTDYIFGTREQLHRALNDIFSDRSYDLFTVIQTPGTSLLGEALEPELEELKAERSMVTASVTLRVSRVWLSMTWTNLAFSMTTFWLAVVPVKTR